MKNPIITLASLLVLGLSAPLLASPAAEEEMDLLDALLHGINKPKDLIVRSNRSTYLAGEKVYIMGFLKKKPLQKAILQFKLPENLDVPYTIHQGAEGSIGIVFSIPEGTKSGFYTLSFPDFWRAEFSLQIGEAKKASAESSESKTVYQTTGDKYTDETLGIKFTLNEAQEGHYSLSGQVFLKNGQPASHACVNLCLEDASLFSADEKTPLRAFNKEKPAPLKIKANDHENPNVLSLKGIFDEASFKKIYHYTPPSTTRPSPSPVLYFKSGISCDAQGRFSIRFKAGEKINKILIQSQALCGSQWGQHQEIKDKN